MRYLLKTRRLRKQPAAIIPVSLMAHRQQLALFRIAVLGPLVGARLEHGELVELCREAAARTWELPSGAVIDVSARTIEDWFYAYQRGGFAALHPKRRSDADKSRAITEELASLILRLKQEKPRR